MSDPTRFDWNSPFYKFKWDRKYVLKNLCLGNAVYLSVAMLLQKLAIAIDEVISFDWNDVSPIIAEA